MIGFSHKMSNHSQQVDNMSDETAVDTPAKEWTPRSTLLVAGASTALFVSVGLLNSFGVFQDYYAQEALRNNSAFQISWLGSFGLFAVFAFGIPAGWLTDRYGPQVGLTLVRPKARLKLT